MINWPIKQKRSRLGVEGELPVEPICILKFIPSLTVKKAEIKIVLDDIIHSFDANYPYKFDSAKRVCLV